MAWERIEQAIKAFPVCSLADEYFANARQTERVFWIPPAREGKILLER